MAYPSSETNIDDNLQTRCSNCLTVFEVSRSLLESSDTRVRCGECLSIFDAREGLREDDSPVQDSLALPIVDKAVSFPDDINSTDSAETLSDSPDSTSEFFDTPDEAESNEPEPEEPEPDEPEPEEPDATDDENATANQADTESAALAGLSKDTTALDVTYSDFDLFSEEADLPEIAYFDQTRDTASFDFDTVSLEDDETFSDTLFAHDVTIDANVAESEAKQAVESADVDFVRDESPAEPLIFNYQDGEPASTTDALTGEQVEESSAEATEEFEPIDTAAKSKSPWLLRILLFLTVTSLLAGLYIYRERDNLANNVVARPILEAGCLVFRCDVPARVDLSALQAVQRKAFSHPTVDNALVLTMGIRNDAQFDQALPVLAISLTDRGGRTVAKRDFFPKDYLESWSEGDTIAAGKRLDVTLEVKDPGNRASGFQLKFRTLP